MRVLTEHLGWKAASLAAAILLWFVIAGDVEVATSIPVTVQYRNLPADMEITGDQVDRLFLRVHGPLSRVSATSLAKTSLVLDLGDVNSTGEQMIALTGRELGLASGVQLIRVVPSQIRVRLERRISKTVPVELRVSGGPPAGYRVTSQRISPETVRIAGPETHVAGVRAASTLPVDLSSTVGTAEFRVPVAIDDPHVRLESPNQISVSVTLTKTY